MEVLERARKCGLVWRTAALVGGIWGEGDRHVAVSGCTEWSTLAINERRPTPGLSTLSYADC